LFAVLIYIFLEIVTRIDSETKWVSGDISLVCQTLYFRIGELRDNRLAEIS